MTLTRRSAPDFYTSAISDGVDGPLGRDTTHGQKAGDRRNGDADQHKQRDLTNSEIQHGDQQADLVANGAVDQSSHNARTDGGKGEVDHGNDERLREEDAEDTEYRSELTCSSLMPRICRKR